MIAATVEAQRTASLLTANEVRERRATLKSAIASGRTSLTEALTADDDWTRTMRVADLLRVTPGLGPVRVSRAMRACRFGPGLTLASFSDRRRQELITWLATNCPSAVIS